jgi:tRNA A37 threonylcarbamoyladenosine synthetase subunit TsaC/SUA5/YrdC
MNTEDTAACQILQLTEPAHRSQAVDALIHGQIIITAFNGIFVLVGDADDPTVPQKIAIAKQRPQSKGVALVCPPEFLAEHVALHAPVLQTVYPFAQIQALYRAVHALGLILPATVPGAPPHVVQAGTILNVWTEQPPESPIRQLVLELRQRGRRALVGTSANLTGQPTITVPARVQAVFAGRVPLMLLDTFDRVPPQRQRSASIVDLTHPIPRLVREGSVTAEELRVQLRHLQLGEPVAGPDVIWV